MGVLAGDAGNVNVSGLMGVDEDGVVVVGTCNGVPSGVVPGPRSRSLSVRTRSPRRYPQRQLRPPASWRVESVSASAPCASSSAAAAQTRCQ